MGSTPELELNWRSTPTPELELDLNHLKLELDWTFTVGPNPGAILKIIFVCGNPTDWAKNLPTQIFFFDTLKNCRLADSELRNSRVHFFFIKKIWNISFISDEKLRKHALFHRLSTLNKWLFFERWKIIKQKQICFVIKLK